MDAAAAAGPGEPAPEIQADPLPPVVLANVGRHLPLSAMRTCRLVCKRWAAVIGESVRAVGVSADLLRTVVLGDHEQDPAGEHGGAGAGCGQASESDSGEDEDDGDGGRAGAEAPPRNGDPSVVAGRRRAVTVAAMVRLRRLSRRLACAFPRAHTAVIHQDVGYGDHAAPDPHESAARLAALLGGLRNLARIRLAVKSLNADDAETVEPEEAQDMEFVFSYTLRLLGSLLTQTPPPEARALAPTAAALRRRRQMLPNVPWPGAAQAEEEGAAVTREPSGGGSQHRGGSSRQRRLRHPPCWALELCLGALPRSPEAWSDLAELPQLATLLLPSQRPRLPSAALPHLAQLTSLRALQLSVAGAAAQGGVGLLAAPGVAVSGLAEDELCARVGALSALTGLTHLGLHGNALPTRPLSRALASLTGLRDLFLSGGVVVDVEALAGGLTALERIALPQQLSLWEVELLATHCRKLRHLEICGVWEACAWEGGEQAPVASIMPPHLLGGGGGGGAGAAAAAAAAAGAGQQEPGEWAPQPGDGGDGAGGAAAFAGWLQREIAAAAAWRRLMRDGWGALQLSHWADPAGAPRDLAAILGLPWRRTAGADRSPPPDRSRWVSIAQLSLLCGLHRALHGLAGSDPAGVVRDDAGVLAGIRLRNANYSGCSVSAIAVLSATLASARTVPGYDPSDVVVAEGQVPAGALDQMLDELYANELPEPEWEGLDGTASEGEGDDAATRDEDGGGGGDVGSRGRGAGGEARSPRAASATRSTPWPGRAQDAAALDAGAPSSPRCRGSRPSKPRGVTSVFTWAGNGACLGPLGALLPQLSTLSVALPPALASLVGQEGGPVDELPEATITFGDAMRGPQQPAEDSGRSGYGSGDGGDGDGGSGGSNRVGSGSTGSPAASPAALPPPSHFTSLRSLTLGCLTNGDNQWDPCACIGDAVLVAAAEGLPALETLQLDGVLCFSGEGLSRLSALTDLKALALHHWMNTLAPMPEQLLRVPVSSLPRGLTSLRAMHVQFDPDWPQHSHHGAAGARGPGAGGVAPQACGRCPPHLGAQFSSLVELDYAHADHASADRLLDAALPHCANLRLLHISGPGAFYHTPLPQAFVYGVGFGLEAASAFAVPWSIWLPALLGRGGGSSWLRHVAALPALAELHLDLPLALPAQVRELVDALVARGALHSLALHGVALSLVTRRDWVVRQLARLRAVHLQAINISFGRHALATLPSWLRGGGGGEPRHRGRPTPAPEPRDLSMLARLADAFRGVPEAHFSMHTGELEESVHSVPWGLPLPAGAAPLAPGGGDGGGGGPLGEGVEEQQQHGLPPPPLQEQQQPQQEEGAGGGGPGEEFRFPRAVRLAAHVLAVVMGPRAAVRTLTNALAPGLGAEDLASQWQLSAMLMEVVAPHHDPERVELPQGVVGVSWASAMFAAGAAAALAAVVPTASAAAAAAWRHWAARPGP